MTWQPLERSTPLKHGTNIPQDLDPGTEYWINDQYAVHLQHLHSDNPDVPDAIHLSIRNQDRSTRHDWRDFQRIKNQLAGPEWDGVEIYPAESRLVDMANQYHLWCYPFSVGIGWQERLVGNQAQADMTAPGSKQRDPEIIDLKYGGLSKLKDMKRHAQNYEKESP